MSTPEWEVLRECYRPKKIQTLLVGESCPNGGTFFYCGNSHLYQETAKVFEGLGYSQTFSLKFLKNYGWWLYDICPDPVNHLPRPERRSKIRENIQNLETLIQSEKPKHIIVCKKDLVEHAILSSPIMDYYQENQTIFFLPFPSFGNQKRFRECLSKLLISDNLTVK